MSEVLTTRPEDIPGLFVEHWNNRDARALANLFTEDAEFVNVVGLWWHDRESIFKAHDYGLKRIFNNSDLRLMKTKVKYLSDHIAVVHARMRLKGQTELIKGEQPDLRYNIFTFVCMQTDKGWKCEAAHNTDIIPGAETWINSEDGRKAANYRTPKK